MPDSLNPPLLVLSLHVAAVCLLWRHARVATLALALSMAVAWHVGLMDLRGGLSAVLVGSTVLAARLWAAHDWPAHGLVRLTAALMCLALALHLLPGFHNPRLLDRVLVREGATPFTLYASLDKALAGWMLLALVGLGWRDRQALRAGLRGTLAPVVVTCTGVIGLAWALGRVQWEGWEGLWPTRPVASSRWCWPRWPGWAVPGPFTAQGAASRLRCWCTLHSMPCTSWPSATRRWPDTAQARVLGPSGPGGPPRCCFDQL